MMRLGLWKGRDSKGTIHRLSRMVPLIDSLGAFLSTDPRKKDMFGVDRMPPEADNNSGGRSRAANGYPTLARERKLGIRVISLTR